MSVYDQTNEQFFPPMVRFEINDKKMPIIGSLENLSVGDIYFSEHLFALVKSITVYRTYLIGNLGFERNNKNLTKFLQGVKSKQNRTKMLLGRKSFSIKKIQKESNSDFFFF